jgi:hypothetical protein
MHKDPVQRTHGSFKVSVLLRLLPAACRLLSLVLLFLGKASAAVRRKLLADFIKRGRQLTGPELETAFNNAVGFLFAS